MIGLDSLLRIIINENIKLIINLFIKSLKFIVRFCMFWVYGWLINVLIFYFLYNFFLNLYFVE